MAHKNLRRSQGHHSLKLKGNVAGNVPYVESCVVTLVVTSSLPICFLISKFFPNSNIRFDSLFLHFKSRNTLSLQFHRRSFIHLSEKVFFPEVSFRIRFPNRGDVAEME
ncbi:hypothetical protein ISN44_As12g037980 [Arabidopsis suecica]|uniref:Uncharacterized protein n=1 Tax=Arabidopsis suecica TaxID=45249 RepID=A0A8T1YR52_ARASU|nr:hypothetical protein ISN44_As12g037980 [Arabidopsis suecica]